MCLLKIVLIHFIESQFILLWKWILFGKVALWDELCDLRIFLVVGRWNARVYTYTHKWLVCMHSWGNWIALRCFGSLTPIGQSCEIYYTNLVKNIHWIRLLWNSFMNGLLWIKKDVWMIDGCWIWCLLWCGVFSPLLELWEWHEVVELLGDVIGVYICICAYMLLVSFLTCWWNCW